MSTQQISITIKNKLKYTAVAQLVDRPEFIIDLMEAREYLNIKILISHDRFEIEKWRGEELNNSTKSPTKFQIIADKLLNKYRKPPFFLKIIQVAILCGVVTSEDYSVTAYAKIIDPYDYVERYKKKKFLGYPTLAIVISPETKIEEVKQLFKTGLRSTKDYYKEQYLKQNYYTFRPKTEIETHREWYWRNKYFDESPLDIAILKNGGKEKYQSIRRLFDKKSYLLDDNTKIEYYDYLDKVRKETGTINTSINRYKKFLA